MPIKILSIGAAIQDVFLLGNVLQAQKTHGQWVEELPLGAKLDVDKIVFSTGGGATNASVTFSRQGLSAAFMGQIGQDPAGEAVMAKLKEEGVNTELVTYCQKYATGYSVLLLAPSGERTILTYRGASTHYEIENMPIDLIRSDWIYLSSLAGNTILLDELIATAQHRAIKIAFNPGKGELAKAGWLQTHLSNFEILILNRDEAMKLAEGETAQQLAYMIAQKSNLAVVTDGPRGVSVSDGNLIYSAGMYEDVKVIDRTGAGDAFGSGFVSVIARGGKIEDAITLGSANSTSVVSKIGAKEGILRSDTVLHPMDIVVTDQWGNICQGC